MSILHASAADPYKRFFRVPKNPFDDGNDFQSNYKYIQADNNFTAFRSVWLGSVVGAGINFRKSLQNYSKHRVRKQSTKIVKSCVFGNRKSFGTIQFSGLRTLGS